MILASWGALGRPLGCLFGRLGEFVGRLGGPFPHEIWPGPFPYEIWPGPSPYEIWPGPFPYEIWPGPSHCIVIACWIWSGLGFGF